MSEIKITPTKDGITFDIPNDQVELIQWVEDCRAELAEKVNKKMFDRPKR